MASVKVLVHAAQGLPIMDSRSRLCDAYVSVRLDDKDEQSAVVHNSRNPTFKFYAKFVLTELQTLQEDPLEVRVYDRDRIMDDLIGTVFIDLNTMLQSDATPRIDGWFPIIDPFEGLHGELHLSVWIKFHAAANAFVPIVPVVPGSLFRSKRIDRALAEARRLVVPRGIARGQSLTSDLEGVVVWSTSRVDPERYRVINVFGIVEELLCKHDPERKRLGFLRAADMLEARSALLFRLSGKVRRQLTKKVLELGCNCVLGYRESFDVDDPNGIVVRAVGTPCVLVQIDRNHADVRAPRVVTRKKRTIQVRQQQQQAQQLAVARLLEGEKGAAVVGETARTPLSGPAIPSGAARIEAIGGSSLPSNHGLFPPQALVGGGSFAGEAAAAADQSGGTPPDALSGTAALEVEGVAIAKSPMPPQDGDGMMGQQESVSSSTQSTEERARRRGGVDVDGDDDDDLDDDHDDDEDDDDDDPHGGGHEDDNPHRRAIDNPLHTKWNHGQADDARMRYLKDTTGLSRYQVTLVTMRDFPAGTLRRIAGMVSVRSVKHVTRLRSKGAVLQERDQWWAELRDELRANARAMGCNTVVGYEESATYCEDGLVICAAGTAVVVESTWGQLSKGPEDLVADARARFRGHKLCRALHVPHDQANGQYDSCSECGGALVPDVLLLNCELPADVATEAAPRHIEVQTAKARPRAKTQVAKSVSQILPYLEYAVHRQLIARLAMDGLNCACNVRVSLSIDEDTIVATATATGMLLPWLPQPMPPKLVFTDDSRVDPLVERAEQLWKEWQAQNRATLIHGIVGGAGAHDSPDGGIALPTESGGGDGPTTSNANSQQPRLSASALEQVPDARPSATYGPEADVAGRAATVDQEGGASAGAANNNGGGGGDDGPAMSAPTRSIVRTSFRSSSSSSTDLASTSTASRFEFVMQIDDAEDADASLGLLTGNDPAVDTLITTAPAPPRSAHITSHGTTFVMQRMYSLPANPTTGAPGAGLSTEFVTRCGLESRRALSLHVRQVAARLHAPCMVAGYQSTTTLVDETDALLVKQSGVVLVLAPDRQVARAQNAYLSDLVRAVRRTARKQRQQARNHRRNTRDRGEMGMLLHQQPSFMMAASTSGFIGGPMQPAQTAAMRRWESFDPASQTTSQLQQKRMAGSTSSPTALLPQQQQQQQGGGSPLPDTANSSPKARDRPRHHHHGTNDGGGGGDAAVSTNDSSSSSTSSSSSAAENSDGAASRGGHSNESGGGGGGGNNNQPGVEARRRRRRRRRRADIAIALAAMSPFTLPQPESESESSSQSGVAEGGEQQQQQLSTPNTANPMGEPLGTNVSMAESASFMPREVTSTVLLGLDSITASPVDHHQANHNAKRESGRRSAATTRSATSPLGNLATRGAVDVPLSSDVGAAADLVVTPLLYVPTRPTRTHHGRISHHFIRKCSTRRESTLGSFWNSTLFEAESVVAALARGLGGNAVVGYVVEYHELEVVDGKHALFFSVTGHAVTVVAPAGVTPGLP